MQTASPFLFFFFLHLFFLLCASIVLLMPLIPKYIYIRYWNTFEGIWVLADGSALPSLLRLLSETGNEPRPPLQSFASSMISPPFCSLPIIPSFRSASCINHLIISPPPISFPFNSFLNRIRYDCNHRGPVSLKPAQLAVQPKEATDK